MVTETAYVVVVVLKDGTTIPDSSMLVFDDLSRAQRVLPYWKSVAPNAYIAKRETTLTRI